MIGGFLIEAYPLAWPTGWPVTPHFRRQKSKFGDKSFAVVRDQLLHELKLYRAESIVLSTNIPLRKDGLPYSGYRQPENVGVAIYFKLRIQNQLRPFVFACDKWTKIEENIHAVTKTIEALRGIERWGSSDLMERAFTGFAALPAPAVSRDWWQVLGVGQFDLWDVVVRARNQLLMQHHPDRGGDAKKAVEINRAFDEAKRARGYDT